MQLNELLTGLARLAESYEKTNSDQTVGLTLLILKRSDGEDTRDEYSYNGESMVPVKGVM